MFKKNQVHNINNEVKPARLVVVATYYVNGGRLKL